jgi:ADP-ribose pyrophosphatase
MTESHLEEPRVEVIEKTRPHDGYFRVDKIRLRHRRFAGGWTGEMTREVFERGHAAVVLPYDAVRDEVVLIEQFRIGAFTAGRDAWLVEAVAGIVEPGETAEDVVRREAVEEAGCAITALETIGEVFPSPGGCSELLTLHCGRVDSAGAGGLFGLDHEGEDIRAFVLSFDEAYARLARGAFPNANLVITLQWLALNRERLRREWK